MAEKYNSQLQQVCEGFRVLFQFADVVNNFKQAPPSATPQAGGYPQQQRNPQQGGFPPPPPAGLFPQGAATRIPPPTGGYDDPKNKRDDLAESQVSDKNIRRVSIWKVYAILTVQHLVTFGFVALFVLNEDLRGWSRANPEFFYGALAMTFVLSIALACCKGVGRKAPGNFICLAIFTIAEGFLLGTFSSVFKAEAVLLAVGITTVVCLSLTAFSFQTKCDFTGMGMALFVCLIVLMLFGILTIFLPRSSFPVLHIVYAALGTLLFSFYLVYDTQLMLGGNHKYSITAALNIFDGFGGGADSLGGKATASARAGVGYASASASGGGYASASAGVGYVKNPGHDNGNGTYRNTNAEANSGFDKWQRWQAWGCAIPESSGWSVHVHSAGGPGKEGVAQAQRARARTQRDAASGIYYHYHY